VEDEDIDSPHAEDKPSDLPAYPLLSEITEAIAKAQSGAVKFQTLKAGAERLAIPVRHGFYDRGDVVDELLMYAENHGLVKELGADFVIETIEKGLNTFRSNGAAKPNGVAQSAPKAQPSWRDGMITARDLCVKTFPALKFIVPGILPEGLHILAGRPKLGKSWLTLSTAIAVANGVQALGVDYGLTPAAKGAVLYLALEDGERRLQRRITKILGSARPENWSELLHFKTDWRRLDQGGLNDIRAWHADAVSEGQKPTMVVVDTLAKVRPVVNPKQSSYQSDHDALAGLQKLAEELHLAIIVVHHDRKMDADDVFDTVSGTLGLTGAVDSILILTKKGQEHTLHLRGRDLEEESSLNMHFSRESCRWMVTGTVAQREEQAQSAARTKVLAALKGAAAPMGIPDIMVATETANRHAIDIILGKMTTAGQIKKVSRGQYCHPDHVKPEREKNSGEKAGEKDNPPKLH
jgi:hypothetical protein